MRGGVTVVASPSFQEVLIATRPTGAQIGFERIGGGLAFAYEHYDVVRTWREATATALLSSAVQGYRLATLAPGAATQAIELKQVELTLRQCRYITDPGTLLRRDLYALLRLTLERIGQDRWPAVSDLILRESDAGFLDSVERQADELRQADFEPLFAPADVTASRMPVAMVRVA
jgi:hypothetical protein